eukprot:749140-Hanusia_phi.AAC.2
MDEKRAEQRMVLAGGVDGSSQVKPQPLPPSEPPGAAARQVVPVIIFACCRAKYLDRSPLSSRRLLPHRATLQDPQPGAGAAPQAKPHQ